jgi:two-component system, cell cycle response regulator
MTARILVIEDNQANIDLMVYLIRAAGHIALIARDGEDGLRLARRERPDLILCDIQMPKLSGYDVAQALKADATMRQIPVLAVTAFAMVGDREKATNAGFDSYVSKPIDPETFIRDMESFLDPGLRSDSASAGAPPVGEPAFTGAPAPGRRILVLDNDTTNLDLTASTLGLAGYTVEIANDPEVAFASAMAARPGLIISDVCMPTSSGFEFIQRVKNEPSLRTVPFIFLTTTFTDERARRDGLALGAARFLFRPIEMHVLLETVDICLNGRDEPTS